MSAQHTPGPWFWSARTLRREIIEDDGPACAEDILYKDGDGCISCINSADAKLITAAPDMAEALKWCEAVISIKFAELCPFEQPAKNMFIEKVKAAQAALTKAGIQ